MGGNCDKKRALLGVRYGGAPLLAFMITCPVAKAVVVGWSLID
jgi:hypothetical protein